MMKDHFGKFMFLAVLIAVVAISRFAYSSSLFPTLSLANQAQNMPDKQNPPLLVLPTVSLGANAAAAGTVNNVPNTELQSSTASLFIRVATTTAPTVGAHAAIIADLTTGTYFYSTNPTMRWPTASITKLMTASLVFDEFSLDQQITITPEMFAADPQELTLTTGGTYTVSDLLHTMLMPSSNVAAEAFADTYGLADFMAAMNARAAQWGLNNTYFDDPSGISAANQSTASDMVLLAQKVYTNYPEIFAYTRTPEIYITDLNGNRKIDVKSINNFAGQPDFIGGKTGHTNEADGNLLSVFNYDGHPVVIIVLGTDNRFGDTIQLYNWFKKDFK